MTSIVAARIEDYQLLSRIASISLIESHGHSADPEDMNSYVTNKYGVDAFKEELSNPKNIYHIIYHEDQPAGYSKIIYDFPYENSPVNNITKLERIYLLKEFYDLKLGLELFKFNVDLSKSRNQLGMWLFVWKENHRAFNFYKKIGFVIIGSHDFQISERHSNPNHIMWLKF